MFWSRKSNKSLGTNIESSHTPHSNGENLSTNLLTNEEMLKEIFQNCSDLVMRNMYVNGNTKILVVYIDGLSDTKTLDEQLLKPLLYDGLPKGMEEAQKLEQLIEKQLVAFTSVSTVAKINELMDHVLKANVGILVDGESKALIADLKGFEKRGIQEPTTEATIRGPRDGFTESLRTNTALIRRRIRSPKLKFESFTIGSLSKTDIEIAYIEGVAPETLLQEVRERIERIQVDSVLGSAVIEEFIQDSPATPFPLIQNTERPDVVAGNLVEGRVVILVDNTPFTLIVPTTFWSGLQAVEDYYQHSAYSTFIRFIRFILLSIALLLPSLYVALTTFHPRLIPTSLMISIASAREEVPFPALIEALVMELVFEGLREAGIRLPKAVGSAVSIVGALVIGQAAVQAGIVSPPMVIVVATTGIASFAIPRYNLGIAIRMTRFIMLLLAGFLGLYGILLGFIALTIHLVNLRSFGVPYFTPVSPMVFADFKDLLYRAPRWAMNRRPNFIAGKDKLRIPKGQKPSPKRGKDSHE